MFTGEIILITYKHEPFTDFSKQENKDAYVEGLQTVEGYLGQDYPLNYRWRTYYDRR